MRFLILAVLMLAGAGSAMATVTIEVVPVPGECAADIVVTADDDDLNGNGDSLVAGIAVDVSVDAGQIDSVDNFMTTGESVDGGEGYGIYMGTVTFTGGDPEEIGDVGTPVAPDTAPDNPGQLGTSAIVLEFGCLFNVNTPEAAPLASTTLCRLNLSETATVTLAEDDTRGGVVLIDGGAPSGVVLVNAEVGCWGHCDCCYGPDDCEEAISVGCPMSWCYQYQCRGDINGLEEIVGFVPFPPPGHDIYGPVGPTDLAAFLAAYLVPLGEPAENIDADLDHSAEVVGFVPFPPPGHDVYGRTGATDLAAFLAAYLVPTTELTPCF